MQGFSRTADRSELRRADSCPSAARTAVRALPRTAHEPV